MILQGENNDIVPEALLSFPSDSESENVKVNRIDISYENLSGKYLLWDAKEAGKQYCSMYSTRLDKMRPKVEKAALKKWSGVNLRKMFELNEDIGECAIVGTIFKQQSLKPSILKEVSEESHLMPQPVLRKYVGKDDHLVLEDELQRIQLVGNVNIAEVVTGVVCCVKGIEGKGGKFVVEDIVYAGLPDPIATQIVEEESYLLLASGLELSTNLNVMSVEMLVDYIIGNLGHREEQKSIAKIGRVILGGNFLVGTNNSLPLPERSRKIKELDDILSQIASVCPVDVMPGEYDPANCSLPQQPLHKCLLPKSSKYKTLSNVSNPYECCIGGRNVIGCSGQNVRDIMRCSDHIDPLVVMERICEWGHLAPTAPDTLVSYPFYESEPFVMDSRPDILFTANQDSFDFKLTEGPNPTLLVSVPRFSSDGVCALINLKSLECQAIQFGVDDIL